MNLYFRLFYTLWKSWRQGPAEPTQELSLPFRVWPLDLDLNLHMNNGRYLTLMDLGRMQFMQRLGLLKPILKNRWMPVIGGVHMKYRKPLAPGQRFHLKTKLCAWDEKWFYLEQSFWSGDQVHAVAKVKGLILDGKNSVPCNQLLAVAGHPDLRPGPIPKEFL